MSEDEDKAGVLAVLEAETAAWLRKDFDEQAQHWVHSPQTRRMHSYPHLGIRIVEGWEAIDANHRFVAGQMAGTFSETRVRRERMNIVVIGDMAWATYDQIGDKTDDKFVMVGTQHELKIFQRSDGRWKIACIVVLQRSMDHESCPLIEVAPDKKVLWINVAAHGQIAGHPELIISGGLLRARNRAYEARLQEAVNWMGQQMHMHLPPSPPNHPARAVILSQNDEAAPLFCWVLVEDGKILVSFNDEQQLKRRIAVAQGIYGLLPAQAQLAIHIAEGHDLSAAAGMLGVTINTVRTHLQRMFDKTGAHSQSALVGLLLSAEAPTAR
jgi:DNA-binding CsgD family transcriptional regulator